MARTTSLGLSGCALLVALVPGCSVDAPPPTMVPEAPRSSRIEDLSGRYCYFGPDYNVRAFGQDVAAIPFVAAADFREPTEVVVRASASAVVFRYTGRDGSPQSHTYEIAARGARWHDGALLQKRSSGLRVNGLIFFGDTDYSVSSEEARLFRQSDGQLVLSWTVRNKGYTTGENDGAFRVERSVALLLPPRVGTCEIDTAGLPRQPWFEPGPDLRDPACATILEEQAASLLLECGETPEDADAAVAGTVRAFRDGTDARRFTVESRAGRSYHFAVSRSASACKLRLVGRERPIKYGRMQTGSFKSRPLPGCVCND